jgi:hypothetical protein
MRIFRDDKRNLIVIASDCSSAFDMRAINFLIDFFSVNSDMVENSSGGFTCGCNAIVVRGADDDLYKRLLEGIENAGVQK